MTEEKESAAELSRRELMARGAWASLGVASGSMGAGHSEKLFGEAKPRVDESSPRIFGARSRIFLRSTTATR